MEIGKFSDVIVRQWLRNLRGKCSDLDAPVPDRRKQTDPPGERLAEAGDKTLNTAHYIGPRANRKLLIELTCAIVEPVNHSLQRALVLVTYCTAPNSHQKRQFCQYKTSV